MNWDEFADYLFQLDPMIRYVGVVDDRYQLIISKTRKGVVSIVSDDMDRSYMPIAPPIIVEAVEKLEKFVGNLEGVVARYEKLVFLFFRHQSNTVILTAEIKIATPLLTKVSQALRELADTQTK